MLSCFLLIDEYSAAFSSLRQSCCVANARSKLTAAIAFRTLHAVHVTKFELGMTFVDSLQGNSMCAVRCRAVLCHSIFQPEYKALALDMLACANAKFEAIMASMESLIGMHFIRATCGTSSWR